MTSKPILYEITPSPPVRAVKVLAKALNMKLDLKPVDLFNKQNLSEDYLKVNPAHTVPTLVDDGTVLWDSHAILIYLVEKYAKNDYLYPTDIIKRATVNQLLFFDTSVMTKLIVILRPVFFEGEKGVTAAQIATLDDSLKSIERVLEGKNYVTGSDVSLADISLVTTLTSVDLISPINPENYPNLTNWIKRMEKLPYYEPNAIGLKAHSEVIEKYLG